MGTTLASMHLRGCVKMFKLRATVAMWIDLHGNLKGVIYSMADVTSLSDPPPLCRCVVIEDSVIGMQAAKAAGMRCIVTKSRYTENESFDSADAIFDCIGDEGDERFSLDDLLTC